MWVNISPRGDFGQQKVVSKTCFPSVNNIYSRGSAVLWTLICSVTFACIRQRNVTRAEWRRLHDGACAHCFMTLRQEKRPRVFLPISLRPRRFCAIRVMASLFVVKLMPPAPVVRSNSIQGVSCIGAILSSSLNFGLTLIHWYPFASFE
jgi:hypothetical protein